MPVPIEFLAECFVYDAESGDLRWKTRPEAHFSTKERWLQWNTRHAGKIAGANSRVAIIVRVTYANKQYTLKAHRVVFVMLHGRWPQFQIDHIDTNPLNNRFLNLREATHAENQQNRRHQGVRAYPNGWRAQIHTFGREIHLGCFTKKEDARSAYLAAKLKYHPFAM